MATSNLDAFRVREIVYAGYVNDPRNTDNAWIESAICLFHCNDLDDTSLDHPSPSVDPDVLAAQAEIKWHTLAFDGQDKVGSLSDSGVHEPHMALIRGAVEKLLSADSFKLLMTGALGKSLLRAGVMGILSPETPTIKRNGALRELRAVYLSYLKCVRGELSLCLPDRREVLVGGQLR